MRAEILNLQKLNVKYNGFISNIDYSNLLDNSDLCVALQKDSGRHSQFKTPSKVYEYLGNSKLVIATDVGDLSEISEEIIKICKPLDPYNLYKIFINIINKKDDLLNIKNKIFKYSKSEYDLPTVGEKLHHFLN